MLSNRLQFKLSGKGKGSALRFFVAGLVAFVAIYQPPMSVSIIYILAAVSWGYLLLFARVNYSDYFGMFMSFVLMFMVLLLVVSINSTALSNISHFFWMFLCSIPVAISFSAYVEKSAKSFDYLFHVLLFAAALQAVLAYLCLFSEDIQQHFFQRMQQVGLYTQGHIEKWGYRIYGYGMSLMYAIPVVQGLIAAWAVLYGIERNKVGYSVLGVLILMSAVISAKIGFVVFVVALLLGLIIGWRIYARHIFRLVLVTLICIVILMYAYSYTKNHNNKLTEWLGILFSADRINEHYIGYFTNPEKWELPKGIMLLLGTGTTRPVFNVDMGVVNDIWIGGLAYFLFSVGVVLYLAKKIRYNAIFPELWQKTVAISFIATFCIADIKGTAFSYSPFFAFFLLVALFSMKNGYVRRSTDQKKV